MQRLAIEIKASDESYQELNSYKDLNSQEIFQFIQTHFVSCKIHNDLPNNIIASITDVSIFERIIVNLSSNAIKHSISHSKIKMFYENEFLSLRVYSPVSFLSALGIHFAKLTNRIDLKNANSPVFFKFFGRTGRGLSIIKRGIIKLNGKMVFSIEGKIVETGFDVPAVLVQDKMSDDQSSLVRRKRVIYFKNNDFIHTSIKFGLQKYIISEKEFNELINSTHRGDKIEIVSDEDINLPESCILKLITKKERIEGLALNWIGDSK